MGLRTPLYESHLAAGARTVDFGGWDMPLHYGSQIDEHHAVRRRAGMFDVSHMGEVEVEGPGALAFLQRVLSNDVAALEDPLSDALREANGAATAGGDAPHVPGRGLVARQGCHHSKRRGHGVGIDRRWHPPRHQGLPGHLPLVLQRHDARASPHRRGGRLAARPGVLRRACVRPPADARMTDVRPVAPPPSTLPASPVALSKGRGHGPRTACRRRRQSVTRLLRRLRMTV